MVCIVHDIAFLSCRAASADWIAGFKFDNTYAWCMRFDDEGQVAEVRAYLDSEMVKEAIEANEGGAPKSSRAPVPQF